MNGRRPKPAAQAVAARQRPDPQQSFAAFLAGLTPAQKQEIKRLAWLLDHEHAAHCYPTGQMMAYALGIGTSPDRHKDAVNTRRGCIVCSAIMQMEKAAGSKEWRGLDLTKMRP